MTKSEGGYGSMMGSKSVYSAELSALPDGEVAGYLRARSGLPGPRANLELMGAFADSAPEALVREMAAQDEEYLRCCGVVGLGRLAAQRPDAEEILTVLRVHAGDGSWRVREATAMALQRLGDDRPDVMRQLVGEWVSYPDPLVRRAAIAGICEPRLLLDPLTAAAALDACEAASDALRDIPTAQRRQADVRTLRKGLGYCWSVAVAASPDEGIPRFLALGDDPDPDIAWVVRSNLGKQRLRRLLA